MVSTRCLHVCSVDEEGARVAGAGAGARGTEAAAGASIVGLLVRAPYFMNVEPSLDDAALANMGADAGAGAGAGAGTIAG